MRATVLFLVFGSGACAAARPPATSLARFEYRRLLMGVEARVVLWAPDAASAEDGARAAFAEIASIEDHLSDWRRGSEASRLAARAGEGPVPASALLRDALRPALAVAEASAGAYDPTVAPLVALWRRSRETGALPEPSERARARALVDWRGVALDDEAGTVSLARAGMGLDFGGVGKCFASSRARRVLAERGFESALVALAGDLSVGAPPPGREGWRLGVAPRGGEPAREVIVADTCLSSSGGAEQFVEIAGTRYSHLVDTRTGLGASNPAAVTVAGPDGAIVDALATALSLLGPDAAPALLAKFPGASALFDEGPRAREYGGFPPAAATMPRAPADGRSDSQR